MHLVLLQPLFGARGGGGIEWLQVAVFLVITFFVVVKKLFDANKGAAMKRVNVPAKQQPRPQAAAAGAAKPMAAGGQQADPLRSQVEEFLRRASQPGGQAQPPQSRPANEIQGLADDRSRTQERRPLTSSQPAPSQKQRPARQRKQRQSVAEHVAEVVASRSKSVGDQGSRLGQRIVAEDQVFDSQLKAKFDHTVGSLAGSVNPVAQEAPPPPADTPARRIAEMLANPDGVRQAVIINEILHRPSDRW